MTTFARRQWPVPAGLLLLAAVPVLAGGIRVAELGGGADVTAANARFFADPVPVVLHIVGATVFCVLGAFQFAPSLRGRRWHRLAGRAVLPCGLIAAVSGLYMTLFYPLPPSDGPLLGGFRIVVGTLMVVALVLAFQAIRRGDVPTHRAWMLRAYAVGIGAGTQAVVSAVWYLAVGAPDVTTRAWLLGAAWAINLTVAEWSVRRREKRLPVTA
ncbi:DUF2306 domain-containing protein [Saccharothrix violaceirubra]|uniref:Putative membrane protein n=1 Tax=Saccharothrix violaceirubra TaxID=413306 RepID=A0A7W7WWN4_9PSEU|nr:DUF2306 domain-containing protein [Saccharothrix violaceirubra]MBB4966530.1 putative membrane protein [Saccharothrix violaceirubra]